MRFWIARNTSISARTACSSGNACTNSNRHQGYSYAAVQSKEIFMSRNDIREKFRTARSLLEEFQLMTSPIYLEFLSGERDMMCTAWGNPTFNPRGWKGPCYLITDAHHPTFKDLIEKTP